MGLFLMEPALGIAAATLHPDPYPQRYFGIGRSVIAYSPVPMEYNGIGKRPSPV